jgi:DNA-binding IclR family transcriptional regulator
MPKKSSKPVSEGIPITTSGVAAVDKALAILRLFSSTDRELSLHQISTSTGLYKSTALRMLASLANALLVMKRADGMYVLGPAIASLHTAYQEQESLGMVILPALENLVKSTHESAAFHVREGNQRLCLFRVDSQQALRDHVKVGDLLPTDKGAGGKVLQAFEGVPGKVFNQIRSDMVFAISGDRTKEISGISAPVFTADGLIGVITLTMPTYRFDPSKASAVKASAKKLTELLGGQFISQQK